MKPLHPDLTQPPDLSHERRIGPQRLQRPVYVDLLPPCNDACPAGEDIQGWLALAQACGVTRQTIIALEAGRYTPSLELAFRIARAFGVGIEDVFQWKEAP